MDVRPQRIVLDKSHQELVIDWSTGERDRFPWSYLRSNCPSATEKAARESAAANPLQVLSKIPSSELVSVRAVGRYALAPTWSDGHSVGIYTWDYLRELANDPRVVRESIEPFPST